MDIQELKRILKAFADEPSDVDVRAGQITAQIRDDIIDASLSYDALQQIYVEENGVKEHWRPWIINRVAKLSQLADRIIAAGRPAVEGALRSPFVAPRARLTNDLSANGQVDSDSIRDDALESLMSVATTFTPGASSVLYLTSDAGEGKTTLISHAAYEQANRYKRKEASSLIVPIPLSGRAFLTFDDAVVAALSNRLRFNYYYYDAFLQLVKMGAIVPAFDGYEEMLVEGSKGEAVSALGNLVQSLDSSGSVVIAARKAFFEYLSFRTQAKLFDAIGDRSATFGQLQLLRWDKALFCKYGALRHVANPSEIYDTVASRLGNDHPLVTRAVLVKRLFDVAAESEDRAYLADKLGTHPHDYFYTFVDAIVRREASEKWLAKVAGEVSEPLLTTDEHHYLLAQLAQEMWQTSSTSLRYDVVDVLVDMFTDTQKKSAQVNRQVKERIRQHSLLTADTARGTGLAFDHEDFQQFYLGESLGGLLANIRESEVHSFLQMNLIPSSTVEQAIQYLERHETDLSGALSMVVAINDSEAGFSFCKENCGAIAVRLAEALGRSDDLLRLERMFFSAEILDGRHLRGVEFVNCIFQPTQLNGESLCQVTFTSCDFERLELVEVGELSDVKFIDCRIESLVVQAEDLQSFDPQVVRTYLRKAGAGVSAGLLDIEQSIGPYDERIKVVERFFRAFMRRTHVDESALRLKMGRVMAPLLFDTILPALVAHQIVEEAPWAGQGVQQRFKLTVPMAAVYKALEDAKGDFDLFLDAVSK